MVLPGLRCKFLVAQPNARWGCSVYEDRFARAPWCHHADVAGPQGFLAHDCPYVTGRGETESVAGAPAADGLPFPRGRVQGKVRLAASRYDALWPAILAELIRAGVPEWIDRSGLLEELNRRAGEGWTLVPMAGERLRLVPPAEERE